MIASNDPALVASVKRHEGYSRLPYLCTAGRVTIGFGRNIDAHPVDEATMARWEDQGCMVDEAEALLADDIGSALDVAAGWPWFDGLPDDGQRILVEMVYQLGAAGVRKFRRMIAALEVADYAEAAREMRDSKWRRDDTPIRAETLAHRMESLAS